MIHNTLTFIWCFALSFYHLASKYLVEFHRLLYTISIDALTDRLEVSLQKEVLRYEDAEASDRLSKWATGLFIANVRQESAQAPF